MFQFHFGSIGSSNSLFQRLMNFCFNSTLVRLEAWQALQQRIQTIGSFNSTLVRLEDSTAKLFDVRNKFQFHFGSIGSFINDRNFLKTTVSIPLWFDWKVDQTTAKGRFCAVSIPLWFDWKSALEFNDVYAICSFNSTLVRLEVNF